MTEGFRGYCGRRVLSADGAYLIGNRRDPGLYQSGPAAPVDFSAREIVDNAGHHQILIQPENGVPFVVSGGTSGDNYLVEVTADHVRWYNQPAPDEAGSHVTRSMLRGFADGALAAGVNRLNIIGTISQSTGDGTLGTPPISTSCPCPGYALMPDVSVFGGSPRGPRMLGHEHGPTRNLEPVDPTTLRRLIPAVETQEGSSGETQLTQLMYEAHVRLPNTEAFAGFCAGIGSQPFQAIGPGTIPFENLMTGFEELWLTAALHGLAVRFVILYPQNEGNWNVSQSTFYGYIQSLHDAAVARVTAFTGGAVTQVFILFNGFNNAGPFNGTYSEQCLAQLQYAIDHPDHAAYATPEYVLERVADGEHFTAASAARDGAYDGRALALLWTDNADPLPLHVTTATIGFDGVLELDVHLPQGCTGLSMQSPNVTNPGNNGLVLKNIADSSNIAIGTIDVQTNKIRITPSVPFAHGMNVEASGAFYTTAGSKGGPTSSARSNLNDGNLDVTAFGTLFPNHLAPFRMNAVAP